MLNNHNKTNIITRLTNGLAYVAIVFGQSPPSHSTLSPTLRRGERLKVGRNTTQQTKWLCHIDKFDYYEQSISRSNINLYLQIEK